MSLRRLAIVGFAVILVLAVLGGASLVIRAVSPHVSQRDATTIAIRQLQQMNPAVSGYVLVSARYDPAPDKVYDDKGNLIASETRSSCRVLYLSLPPWFCHADGAWIIHLRAPAQGGFANNDAYVVVNGTTGSVSSASLSQT